MKLEPHNYPGKLVVFEGIDGSGKDTQFRMAFDALCQMGVSSVVSQTPGGTDLGGAIRDLLFHSVTTHKMDSDACSTLFLASHLQSWFEVVEPALKAGKLVLSNRWDAFSGYAYGIAGGVRCVHPALLDIRKDLSGPVPDLTFFFVGSPEKFLARGQGRDHQNGKLWNTVNKQEKIQDLYLDLFERPGQHDLRNRVVRVLCDDIKPEAIHKFVMDSLKFRILTQFVNA